MSHSYVIVESTARDHVSSAMSTRILEQSRIVNTLDMVSGSIPALESFQANRAGKLWLAIILGDKLKQLFGIFEILNTAWNLRRILDISTISVNHNITKSLPAMSRSKNCNSVKYVSVKYIL